MGSVRATGVGRVEEMSPTPANPAAIDLDEIKGEMSFLEGNQFRDALALLNTLIAAVEALQDICASLEIDLKNSGSDNDDLRLEKEAAEAREVALARVLEVIWQLIEDAEFDDINDDDDLVVITIQAPQARHIRTALAATSEDVIERARAIKIVTAAAKRYLDDDYEYYDIKELNDALVTLGVTALGKEG